MIGGLISRHLLPLHQDSQWRGHQNTQQRDHRWQDHQWQDHDRSEDLACSWKQSAKVPSEDQQDYQWKDRKWWWSRFFRRQLCVQTLANVVHATRSEDRTPRCTHMFLSFVVSGDAARLSTFLITRMYAWLKFAQVTLHLWCLEWFASLRIKNTSLSLMSHPKFLGLHPESFTSIHLNTITAPSDNMLDETGEGITDWNQVPLKRNFARWTVMADSIAFTGYESKTWHRRQQWAHSEQLLQQKEKLQHWG